MTGVQRAPCGFCKTDSQYWLTGNVEKLYGFDCPVCRLYFIVAKLYDQIKEQPLSSKLINCISENAKNNNKDYPVNTAWLIEGEEGLALASEIVRKRYRDFCDLPIVHADKQAELLLLLARKVDEIGHPFSSVTFQLKELLELKILGIVELFSWIVPMIDAGLLEAQFMKTNRRIVNEEEDSTFPYLENCEISITSSGWQQVYSQRRSFNSKKVFIAVQFDWGELRDLHDIFIAAVKQGCKDCGFDAEVVSDRQHLENISDRIVSEIKSARFVVADFSFNNRGVYYEAGMARGLGLPVIHTIMKGHTDDRDNDHKRLHFDVKQINYLEWDPADPKEIQKKLRDRIRAVIL